MLRLLCAADILGKQHAAAVWLECKEYCTSRGPPPYQRASWAEKPSCGGRWKKRQASFKKLKQQGGKGGGRWDGGQSRSIQTCLRQKNKGPQLLRSGWVDVKRRSRAHREVLKPVLTQCDRHPRAMHFHSHFQ